MKNNRTFLEKLLDGAEVEWKKLCEVSEIEKGKQLNKALLAETGEYPVINGGINPSGYWHEYNNEANTIVISQGGASAGYVNWMTTPFFAGAHAYVVKANETLVQKRYAYHFLKMNQVKFMQNQYGAGIPALAKSDLANLLIPIPPLSVQTEIVRILDALTALTSELTSELILRQKQYEYYREKLLSFDSLELLGGVVQWVKLIDLGELIRGNGLQKKDFTETGVPAIHYGQIYTYYGTFATKTKSFVSPELAKKLKKVDYGDVVITNTSENFEDVGKAMVYLGKEQAVTGGHATIFKPNHEKILSKYFVYLTQTSFFTNEKRKYAKGTKVIDVSATDMAKIILPIPPLEEQHRIVSILDKFETLTNSITEGLPLAIEQSQKRYEYYRELLLNFS